MSYPLHPNTAPLRSHFPMLHTRHDLLSYIENSQSLSSIFHTWTHSQQTEFLDFCTGVRGVKLLYDSFFKEIINPESTPERLEEFLSLLLETEVKILSVLPNDTTRIADEHCLLVTDIIVELSNHSIVNLEIQKIGYYFPGQRSACYSSDMLLRQYKRVRSQRQKNFRYQDINAVYTIVLFEHSPAEFHTFSDAYLHYFSQRSNTGLEIELLQKYLFIPLDIFRKIQYNTGIRNKLEAWLAFLCIDDPQVILRLLVDYPEFKPLYEQVYSLCQNVERVMEMFSNELKELDRNTVQFMIDDMQDIINKQKIQLAEKEQEIAVLKAALAHAIEE